MRISLAAVLLCLIGLGAVYTALWLIQDIRGRIERARSHAEPEEELPGEAVL